MTSTSSAFFWLLKLQRLVDYLVLSCIDNCNSLLVGLSQYLTKWLQGVQNTVSRLLLRPLRSGHILPLLQNLHFLLVVGRQFIQMVSILSCFALWLWPTIFIWPYVCLHTFQNLAHIIGHTCIFSIDLRNAEVATKTRSHLLNIGFVDLPNSFTTGLLEAVCNMENSLSRSLYCLFNDSSALCEDLAEIIGCSGIVTVPQMRMSHRV